MDQRRGELGLRQPTRARTICVKSLHGDCDCLVCRSQREFEATKPAQQVGEPLVILRDPPPEAA